MNVPEDIKREAANIGIKPGAVVRWVDQEPFTVPPYDKWHDIGGDYAWMTRDGAPHYWCWIYGGKYPRFTPTVITQAPEDNPEGLVDGMACEPDEHMRRAIVEKAMELGWAKGTSNYPSKRIAYFSDCEVLQNADWIKDRTILITPGEFYDRLCKMPKPEPPIRIGGHEVKFGKGEISVGCTTVPNDIVRKVYERLND